VDVSKELGEARVSLEEEVEKVGEEV